MYPSIFTFLLLSQTLISSITSNEYINHYIDHSDKNSLLKIDFFVIQNLSIEDDDLKEEWKNLDSFLFSKDLINIKEEPTKLVSSPTYLNVENNFFTANNIEIIQSTQEEKTVSKDIKIEPLLYERVPFQNEMKEIQNNLNRSRDYRVLYYNSWYQPAFNKDKSIPIAIESFKKDKRLYGEIVIYKERFIHIAGRLRLGQKSEENYVINVVPNTFDFQSLLEEMSYSEESKPSEDDYWIETIFNKVSLGLLDLSYEIPKEDKIYIDELIDKPVYFYRDLYEIDKEIKIEAEEFNFIDHPYFSVLIKVEEIAN
jgi:hypothetical protein|tara:strand:+ start:4090 stop:5025 length:936 start_codon:yes stop_codon:yes gene_type:complete